MDSHSASLLLLTLIHLLFHVSARDVLSPGSSLSVERSSDVLHSSDGTFTCGFHRSSPESNAATFSIWFSNSADNTVVWRANPPVYTWRSKVELNTDGSMVLKDHKGQTVWTNSVSSSKAKEAQLMDNGNLIVKDQSGMVLWQSFDYPTDTLLPNQNFTDATKLVSTGKLLVPGNYSFRFDDWHALSLFYDAQYMSSTYWPDPGLNVWVVHKILFGTMLRFLDNLGRFRGKDNFTFESSDLGTGVMRRLTLDYDGNLRMYSLDNTDGKWLVTYMAVGVLCNVRGLCGVNGICVFTPVPACACAPGHEIIDPSDRSKGCMPKFNLSCEEQETKFRELPSTDFLGYDIGFHSPVALDVCKNICLSDCSCKGFSYWHGKGHCYPKNKLFGGRTNPEWGSYIYLKLPKELEVTDSSIPHSNPFGPKYGPDCTTANNNLNNPKKSYFESKYMYFYGFLSAIFLVEMIFVAGGWWFILRRESKQLRGIWPAEIGYEMIVNHFRRYTYKELQIATRKFKDELGRGAFGVVHKGILPDKRPVAVKKLVDINQGKQEFRHELGVIGRINHMNLVRFWGFCSDDPHRILVSEYVENGSLDKTLFGSDDSQIDLKWNQRFKIALGVAKGLAYLHHECLEWVIHCDIKPENILLDENWEPKISDFGLAKLLNRGGSNKNVSRIRGTRGYIAPEWVSSVPITAKVDVYSYGVVLLELLTGARVSEWTTNVDDEVEIVLRRIVRMLAQNMELEGSEQTWITDFIDSRLNGQFIDLQARTMIKLAISCVEEDRSKRPTMENAVQMLLSVDEASSIMQQYSVNENEISI